MEEINVTTNNVEIEEECKSGFFAKAKEVFLGAKDRFAGFMNKLCNSKPVKTVCDAYGTTDEGKAIHEERASKGAEFCKKFGLQSCVAAAAVDFVTMAKSKILGGGKKVAEKHPRISKVVKKIARAFCYVAGAFVIGKVVLLAIAIFPEILGMFLTMLAAVLALSVIMSILNTAFNN